MLPASALELFEILPTLRRLLYVTVLGVHAPRQEATYANLLHTGRTAPEARAHALQDQPACWHVSAAVLAAALLLGSLWKLSPQHQEQSLRGMVTRQLRLAHFRHLLVKAEGL